MKEEQDPECSCPMFAGAFILYSFSGKEDEAHAVCKQFVEEQELRYGPMLHFLRCIYGLISEIASEVEYLAPQLEVFLSELQKASDDPSEGV